ncbi:MAG: cyclase family protein [Rubrobacteraceae bacterium]
MCSPQVIEEARNGISRRGFLKLAGAAAVVGTAVGTVGPVRHAQAQSGVARALGGEFVVQDLTHVLGPDFPVFPGYDPMRIEDFTTIEEDGFNSKQLSFNEHTGTHMDAPVHFSAGGETADRLSPERFFAPLAVVDISGRAASDDDAAVTMDDILIWEEQHGSLPAGVFVAMYSGWEERISEPGAFVNADDSDTPHFPGFGPEVAKFLISERDVVGVGVDTLSLDIGASQDFGAHNTVLPAGKYGLENLANLGRVGPSGAAILVGGPKHEGATGGPSRVFAISGSSLPDTGGESVEDLAGRFGPH